MKQMLSILNLGVNLGPAVGQLNRKQFMHIIEQLDKLKHPLPSAGNVPIAQPSQSAFGASASTWLGTITGAKKY
jgi:hypothetical protein